MMMTKRKHQANKLKKKIHSINLHTVDFIIQQQKGYYFMVYITIDNLMKSGEPLPKETVAAWG